MYKHHRDRHLGLAVTKYPIPESDSDRSPVHCFGLEANGRKVNSSYKNITFAQ